MKKYFSLRRKSDQGAGENLFFREELPRNGRLSFFQLKKGHLSRWPGGFMMLDIAVQAAALRLRRKDISNPAAVRPAKAAVEVGSGIGLDSNVPFMSPVPEAIKVLR